MPESVDYGVVVVGALLPLSIAALPSMLTSLYSAFLIWRYRRGRDPQWRGWIEGQGLVAGLAALI